MLMACLQCSLELIMGNRYPPYTPQKLKMMKTLLIPNPPPRVKGNSAGGQGLFSRLRVLALCVLLVVGIALQLTPSATARVFAFVQQLLFRGK